MLTPLFSLTRALQFGLAASLLSLIFLFIVSERELGAIDTNLKTLSPDFLASRTLQDAADAVASSIENRFTVVLHSADLEQLEEGVEIFQQLVEQSAEIFGADSSEHIIDKVLAQTQTQRFALLTASQREILKNSSDIELVQIARQRLYSISGGARLLPITEDPLGWYSDYLLENLAVGRSYDAPVAAELDSKPHYYFPIFFHIPDGALKLQNQEKILQFLLVAETSIKEQLPTLGFLHSGVFFFAQDAAAKSKGDISLISSVSTVGIALLIFLTFYSLRPLLLPALSVAIGVGAAYLFSQLIFGNIHIITLVFGASLIGVVIDYALHYFYHQKHSGNTSDKAEPHSTDHRKNKASLYRALFFSLLTSCIGYGALALSDLEILQRVAVFSVVGLIFAWLAVMSFGSALVGSSLSKGSALLPSLVKMGVATCGRAPRYSIALMVTAGFLGFALLAYQGLLTSDDPRVFFSPNADLLEQEKSVQAIVSKFEPGTYLIVAGDTVNQVYRHLSLLYENAPAGALLSVLDVIPSLEQQQENWQLQGRIYGDDGAAYPFLSELGVGKEQRQALQQDYEQARDKVLHPGEIFTALKHQLPSLWLENNNTFFSIVLIQQGHNIDALAAIAKAHEAITLVETANMIATAIAKQRQASSSLLGIALVLIAFLLVLRYRQVRALSLLVVPAFAIACTLSLLHLLSVPITLFHWMALFLVLGLGMDYVIFIREIPDAQQITLQAVTLSALTSLLSFGLLGTSSIPVVQAFGVTVLIGNTVNLIGAFFLSQYFATPKLLPQGDSIAD